MSRSHPSELAYSLMKDLRIEQSIVSGGVGNKVQLILEQKADFYVELEGGTKKWDACAPSIVAQQAGLAAVNRRGQAIDFSGPSVKNLDGIMIGDSKIVQKAVNLLSGKLPS